jgi:gliding motility-associated-like protein
MQMKKLYALLFFFSLLGASAMAQTIRYVKAGGTGNGSSWASASGDVQAMINASATGDEVWVAAGTYKPNRRANAVETITANDRYNAFVLKKDVAVYGGFAGTEADKTTRNFTANETILSGNIGDQSIDTDNAYHVVVASGDLGTARLDGFTVTKGYTSGAGSGTAVSVSVNGNSIPATRSPGIINYYSSAAFENLIVTENVNGSDDQSAGATYILYGSPTFTKVKFINNRTLSTSGGAFFIFSSTANPAKPVFTEVDFIGNEGSAGGAVVMSTASSPTFIRCNFEGNKSTSGAAGALYLYSASASVTVIDCAFTNNIAATSGGAFYNGLATKADISGSTFTNNVSTDGTGGAIYYSAGTISVTGCTFEGNKSLTGSSGALYLGTSSNTQIVERNLFKANEAGSTAGAIYISSNSPVVTNNRFYGNIAKTNGGAMFVYGSSSASPSSPVMTGNIFYNNQSLNATAGGGAIYMSNNSVASVVNATFYGNKAAANGGAIYLGSSASITPSIYNSIFYNNTATNGADISNAGDGVVVLKNSITQEFGVDGQDANFVGLNPEFDSEDENSVDFLQLQSISQAVNAGSNEAVPLTVTTDLAGNVRIGHAVVDMGALEYSGVLAEPLKAYIDENTAAGTNVITATSNLTGTITWSIYTGNTNDAFAIDPTTGLITVNNSAAIDYEAKKLFSLRLKAVNQLNEDENVYVLVYLNNLMEDPGTPMIANVVNGILTSYRPKLSGVAEPSSTVILYVDDVEYSANIETDLNGAWNFTFPDALTPGLHSFHIVTSNTELGTSNPSEKASATLKLYTGQVVANNILTPNGDGKNDLWIVQDLTLMYPKNEVLVYDKTGKVVFRKANYQSDWDGTFNGTTLNTGTYYYEINIGAGLKPVKGTLTILRGR